MKFKGMFTLLLVLFASAHMASVYAQSAQAKASAHVDLSARLAEAQGDAKLKETLLKGGAKVATFCGNCHGENGNSVKGDIPNLAGQNPAYMLEQLRQFADGRRRFEFMEGLIKALTADEKVGVVLYYAGQTVLPKAAGNPTLVAKGQDLYQKNCFRCHAQDGRGSDQFARVAGQQAPYLLATLTRYRTGTGARINPLMAANTKLLTDGDIEALAAYVSTMK